MFGAGDDILYQEPEPKKKIWSRSRGKMARRRNTAPNSSGYFLPNRSQDVKKQSEEEEEKGESESIP